MSAAQCRACSVKGCPAQAITRIMIHGDPREWYGCSSEHVRSLISDIMELMPHSRGIRTNGVIRIG